MRISDWSSDVCSSDLGAQAHHRHAARQQAQLPRARRRARPLGIPLSSALPHGSRHVPGSGGEGVIAMNLSVPRPRIAAIAAATLLALGLAPTWALAMDHSMPQLVELTAPAQEAPEPQDLHAGHQMPPAETVG